jgi:hypothetical protein
LRLHRGLRYGAIAVSVEAAINLAQKENAMIRRLHKTGATLAVTLGLAMLAPATLAQTPPANQQAPTNAPAAPTNPGPTPNDAELKNFANAVVQVESIKKSMQPQIASASTPDARNKLKQSAEKKMETAVRDNHLSIHRYVQIADVVQKNSALRAKVQKYMPPQSSSQS